MQTIRIYAQMGKTVKLVHSVTGIAGKIETTALRDQFPESEFMWLR